MNVQEQIKVLKAQISSSQELLTKLEDQIKKEQEFPKMGDIYWRIDDRGSVDNCMYNNYYTDNHRQAIGNFFKTEEQAEFAVEKLKVEKEVNDFRSPFIFGRRNWYLFMDENKQIFPIFDLDEVTYGVVYFESKEKAEEAIEAVGTDRIKKYIFGEGE